MLGGAITITSTFNQRLQPLEIQATTSGAPGTPCAAPGQTGNLLDLTYNFNYGSGDNGNAASITNNIDGTRSQTFQYDALNRLQTAQTSGTYSSSSAHCWGEQYTYDAWANLLSIGVSNTSLYNGCTQEGFSQSVSANNQISGFSYDAAGNLIGPTGASYTYDAENHLVSAAGVNYTYDGDGERIEKSNGEMYWYTSGGEVLDETDLSGNLTSEYVFFAGARIARRDGSGNVFYYLTDHLGTSREIVQAGQTTACYDADFYPFGGERAYTNTCPQNYKFTGKERDPESGLDDFEARFYGSSVGRFTSPDDSFVGWQLNDPQSLNLYAYVQDNPVNDVDPTGHCLAMANSENGHQGFGAFSSATCSTSDIGDFMDVADFEVTDMGFGNVFTESASAMVARTGIVAQAQAQGDDPPQPIVVPPQPTVVVHGNCDTDPSCDTRLAPPPYSNRAYGLPQSIAANHPVETIGPETDWFRSKQASCVGQGVEAAGKDLIMYDEANAVVDAAATGSVTPLKQLFSGGTAATAVGQGAKYVATHRAAQKAIKAAARSAGYKVSANAAGKFARGLGKFAGLAGLGFTAYAGYEGYKGCMSN